MIAQNMFSAQVFPSESWEHRITPAHAGNRVPAQWVRLPRWDHPRTCGEQKNQLKCFSHSVGSPPHMRGTVDRNGQRAKPGQDHPRTCGEQNLGEKYTHRLTGSPPHMRGTDSAIPGRGIHAGITPAHAGNSTRCEALRCNKEDHPRTCGEQRALHAQDVQEVGSPPHMRGTVKRSMSLPISCGITPAHAGNSC